MITAVHETTPRDRINRIAETLERLIGHNLVAAACRFGIAGVFFLSGRTKVDGLLIVNDNAVALFADEYKLPLISPEIGAHAAAYAEHLFPILLVLGLFTRYSALALLGMTAVIQFLVYPGAWATHLTWAAILLYLVGRGGGAWSLDRALGIR